MHAPIENQQFHIILADIAVMSAINTYDRQSLVAVGPEYSPGSAREGWLARTGDPALRSRVDAMATAGLASLHGMHGHHPGQARTSPIAHTPTYM